MSKTIKRTVKIFIVFVSAFIVAIVLIYLLSEQKNETNRNVEKSIKYAEQFDNTQNYVYINQSEEVCYMLIGCEVEVYLKGEKTGESLTILFKNGKIVPMKKAIKLPK